MGLLPAGLTPTQEKLPEKTRLTDSRTSLLGWGHGEIRWWISSLAEKK